QSLDGAWVGTWRPHHPRGLILAPFTSPGPKYSLPGTTAKTTIARGPLCAHFKDAKPPVADNCSSGPRYYVLPSITRNGRYVAPEQRICGLPKIKTEVTPGRGEYSFPNTSARQAKCAFLLP
ncbi:ODF3A protein, partial [Syrrhaptes paradoxus]|nr:ODF3A protein [Syrrhaptes paradoxus]